MDASKLGQLRPRAEDVGHAEVAVLCLDFGLLSSEMACALFKVWPRIGLGALLRLACMFRQTGSPGP